MVTETNKPNETFHSLLNTILIYHVRHKHHSSVLLFWRWLFSTKGFLCEVVSPITHHYSIPLSYCPLPPTVIWTSITHRVRTSKKWNRSLNKGLILANQHRALNPCEAGDGCAEKNNIFIISRHYCRPVARDQLSRDLRREFSPESE